MRLCNDLMGILTFTCYIISAIDKVNPPSRCCTCTLPECFTAPDGKPDAGCYIDIDRETAFGSFHAAFIYRCIKNLPFVKGNYKYEPCTSPVETVTTTTPGGKDNHMLVYLYECWQSVYPYVCW